MKNELFEKIMEIIQFIDKFYEVSTAAKYIVDVVSEKLNEDFKND